MVKGKQPREIVPNRETELQVQSVFESIRISLNNESQPLVSPVLVNLTVRIDRSSLSALTVDIVARKIDRYPEVSASTSFCECSRYTTRVQSP